jgi:NAD(P)-dependent dehydrogenase (short-subunit alcohol dehydrogenase family)
MQDLVDDPNFETLTLDVCSNESVTKARKEVERLTGNKLQILVNNACVLHLLKQVFINDLLLMCSGGAGALLTVYCFCSTFEKRRQISSHPQLMLS